MDLFVTLNVATFKKVERYRKIYMCSINHGCSTKAPVLPLSKRYRRQRESTRWAPTIPSAARRRSVQDHLQSGYKRDARMDIYSLLFT
jgi:hypothetical protein